MSRIGKRPIIIPEGVQIEITPTRVKASCAANVSELKIPAQISVKNTNGSLVVERKDESKAARSLHGLTSRLLKNILTGVKDGFIKELEFNGTGYRVAVNGDEVVLNMGYSHEVKLSIPEGITVTIKKNVIALTGTDKQKVGQFAARIREVRGPEVYKGKGIKYKNEKILRKAGKKAASA